MSKEQLSGSAPATPTGSQEENKGAKVLVENQSQDAATQDGATGKAEAFLSNGLLEHYTPIDSYEGRHRYDPTFTWTAEEERKLVRKVRPHGRGTSTQLMLPD